MTRRKKIIIAVAGFVLVVNVAGALKPQEAPPPTAASSSSRAESAAYREFKAAEVEIEQRRRQGARDAGCSILEDSSGSMTGAVCP
jgi:hypothetical protein